MCNIIYIMKKLILTLTILLTFVLNSDIYAKGYLPENIYINNINKSTTTTFKAGDKVELNVKLSPSEYPDDRTTIDYGVYREIYEGNGIFYEPIKLLKTEKIYSSEEDKKISIEIPNVLGNEKETYIIYAEIKVKNDPDKENIIFSKSNFHIIKDDTVVVKYTTVNLLHSNGYRFSVNHGPTIYDLSKAKYKGVASSTSLEIGFESNTDLDVNAKIEFSKLRSDVVIDKKIEQKISIKNGINEPIIIPLPTFNYDPGVYKGVITFDNKSLDNIEFQYIVAGDSVTLSDPQFFETQKGQYVLDFNVYGTPIDMDLDLELNNLKPDYYISLISTSTLAYNSQFIFKDKKGKDLYSFNKDIDFSSTTYRLEIPTQVNINKLDHVYIKVVDKDGKILFEGNKKIYTGLNNKDFYYKLFALILLSIIILVLIFVFKHKYLRIVLIILLILSIFFGIKVIKAETWNLGLNYGSYKDNYNTYFGAGESFYVTPSIDRAGYILKFNENLATKKIPNNENLKVTYKASLELCTNTYPGLYVGFSFKDIKDAIDKKMNIDYGSVYSQLDGEKPYSPAKHRMFYITKWLTTNIGVPKIGDTLYVIRETTGKWSRADYQIPLNVYDPNPLCDNSHTEGETQCVSGIKKKWVCDAGSWNLKDTGEYCLDVGCSCNGRDKVCVDQNGIVSTTTNSSSCALSSNCTAVSDADNTIFTIIPKNTIGDKDGNIQYIRDGISYTKGKNDSYIYTTPKSTTTQSISVILKDLYDNSQVVSKCSIDNSVTKENVVEVLPDMPTIILTKDPKVSLNKGGACTVKWTLENLSSNVKCKLVGTDGTDEELTKSGERVFKNLIKNQKYTITCADTTSDKVVTSSVLCRINSTYNEN